MGTLEKACELKEEGVLEVDGDIEGCFSLSTALTS